MLSDLGVRLVLVTLVPAIFSVSVVALSVLQAKDSLAQAERRSQSAFAPVLAQQQTVQGTAVEAKQLYQEGVQLYRNRQFDEALTTFQQALAIFQAIGDRGNIGATLNNIGLIYDTLGQLQEALKAYQDALANTSSTDLEGNGNTLYNMGVVYDKLGQYQSAFSSYQQALAIRRQLGNQAEVSKTLSNLGAVANNLGQYQQAVAFYQEALSLYQQAGDLKNVRATLQKIAVVQANLGENKQAIESLEKALTNSHDERERGEILNKLGELYNNLGRYQQALKSLMQALDIHQKAGDDKSVGIIRKNIGAVYTNLGQPEKALEYLQQSLEILRKTGEPQDVLLTLNDLAIAYRKQNQIEKSLALLKEALEISSQAGDKARYGAILNNIGTVYDNNGQAQKALEFYQQALDATQQAGNRPALGAIFNNIGVVYDNDNQHQKALEFYQQALSIGRDIGDKAGVKQTLYNMGASSEKQKQIEQAIDFYKQAVEITESIQSDTKIEELKASFASQQIDVYSRLINLLWEQGDFEAAFNYVERSRSRSLLDQLVNSKIDLSAGGNAGLLAREQSLKAETIALRQQLFTLRDRPQSEWDDKAIANVENELAAREKDYEELLTQLKIQSPQVADLISVDVVPLADIQHLLADDTTLIEYFVTEQRTLAFIITNNSLKSVSLDVNQTQLVEQLKLFRDFSDLDNPHPAQLQQLYRWIVAPLKSYLNTPKVGIVPHSVLHYLPFAALSDGSRYLSDDYTLFSLPSANVLRFLPKERPSGTNTVLALGDPVITEPLPVLEYAKQEAEAIARLFNSRALVGKAATESILWSQAREAATLHLAVHGEYNPNNPLFSTLYLAGDDQNDGRLEVYEIYGLDLREATNLVVLSACQTQIGEVSKGDEVVGLNRAFLFAGTPTVIASLWNVDDTATGRLMERFYSHLKEGMDKAQALRQAQIEVRSEYPHPYFWAAFSLTGDAER